MSGCNHSFEVKSVLVMSIYNYFSNDGGKGKDSEKTTNPTGSVFTTQLLVTWMSVSFQ